MAQSRWEAPIDVFETDDALTILVALPGVELDSISVTLSAGTLLITGERPLPPELQNARILRMEIPYGQFERRIDLPPVPFQISGRHLANGCLMLRLRKDHGDDAGRAADRACRCRRSRRPRLRRAIMPGGAEIGLTIPEDALILITTRNLVLFPGTVLPMTLGPAALGASRRRPRSGSAARSAWSCSATRRCDAPMPADLHQVGTEANLLRYVTSPDGSHHVICQGERRFRITEFLDGYPFFVARVERVPEIGGAEHRDRRADAASAQPGARSPAIAAADPGRAGQCRAGRRPRRRRWPI